MHRFGLSESQEFESDVESKDVAKTESKEEKQAKEEMLQRRFNKLDFLIKRALPESELLPAEAKYKQDVISQITTHLNVQWLPALVANYLVGPCYLHLTGPVADTYHSLGRFGANSSVYVRCREGIARGDFPLESFEKGFQTYSQLYGAMSSSNILPAIVVYASFVGPSTLAIHGSVMGTGTNIHAECYDPPFYSVPRYIPPSNNITYRPLVTEPYSQPKAVAFEWVMDDGFAQVIRLEDTDVAWCNRVLINVIPEKCSLNINVIANGQCSVYIDVIAERCVTDIETASVRVPGLCNLNKNIRVLYPDVALPLDMKSTTLLEPLIEAEETMSGQRFIVTNHAAEYLKSLNIKNPHYSEELQDSLFFAELREDLELKKLSDAYTIGALALTDIDGLESLAQFKQKTLPVFRSMPENKESQDSYHADTLTDEIVAPGIHVFVIKQDEEIIGSLTFSCPVTSHLKMPPDNSTIPSSFGYMYDLCIAPKFCNDANFICEFFGTGLTEIKRYYEDMRVVACIASMHPLEETLSQRCLDFAKTAGIFRPFTMKDQERLGVVAHFTAHKMPARKHIPALPRSVLGRFCLMSEKRKAHLDATTVESCSSSVSFKGSAISY